MLSLLSDLAFGGGRDALKYRSDRLVFEASGRLQGC